MRILPAPKPGENSYQVKRVREMLPTLPGNKQLELLGQAVKSLQSRYGTWKTTWGDVNRYQRPADGVTF
jgi:acyl-homoserine-lactone acylase